MILKRARLRLATRIDRALPEPASADVPVDTSLNKAKPTKRSPRSTCLVTSTASLAEDTSTRTNLELAR